jgi:hypothetical protein
VADGDGAATEAWALADGDAAGADTVVVAFVEPQPATIAATAIASSARQRLVLIG